MKFAPEGYPFFAVFAGITAGAYFLGNVWMAFVPFLLFLFMLWFFRDPERTAPAGDDVFVAPADGKVIVVQSVREDRYLKADALMVSIFMSPLSVHVNRAPCDGTVDKVQHNPGKFLKAFLPEASVENDNIAMIFSTRMGRIVVTQVAGAVARRCVCRVQAGAALRKGERYGMIKFSSRVDLYLPPDTKIAVQLGDMVTAGETVIGRSASA
ncbi:MAG TPA: phosphatidylserine decarboxylase family protein [Dissulfurispiraceae bacterium]|nr:phosphatidylserine decarboxylase family protein [Dissulfurispiraceae bacterium]